MNLNEEIEKIIPRNYHPMMPPSRDGLLKKIKSLFINVLEDICYPKKITFISYERAKVNGYLFQLIPEPEKLLREDIEKVLETYCHSNTRVVVKRMLDYIDQQIQLVKENKYEKEEL